MRLPIALHLNEPLFQSGTYGDYHNKSVIQSCQHGNYNNKSLFQSFQHGDYNNKSLFQSCQHDDYHNKSLFQSCQYGGYHNESLFQSCQHDGYHNESFCRDSRVVITSVCFSHAKTAVILTVKTVSAHCPTPDRAATGISEVSVTPSEIYSNNNNLKK